MRITLQGMDDAQRQMARIERGAAALRNYVGVVYSKMPYAYGIEHGRHQKSGKLARKAGGAFYMRRAVDTVLAGADADLSEGLKKVTAPGVWVVRRLALWARRLARANAPRGGAKKSSYRLWKSVQYQVRKK